MNGKSKLPLIPGFVIQRPKENYHLPQCWLKLENSTMLVEKKHADNNWILNDGKILCFNAYFRQNLNVSPSYQIRNVKILFYVEDGTLQVIEPRTDNSGIPQGCIVKRQKVACALPNHADCIGIADLNVQKQVKIFDRIYTITDCDGFTKAYLNRAGIKVPVSIETPKDPVHQTREQMKEANKCEKSKKSQNDENKLEKFLKFDNLCLKFDAYWDDRKSLSGDIHKLIVYYYLADDTIQINEIPREGRPTILYKRLKLPKKTDDVLMIDQKTSSTVLNVLGPDFMKARCIPDRLAVGKLDIDCYSDEDLRIGQVINVFGRPVVLTNCDKFTREYYQEKYGIEEFNAIQCPKDMRWISENLGEHIIPPYNGFGSFEDSESNCVSIQPKPPQRDMKKFLELDKSNLRFKAQMVTSFDEDYDREFVITYYLSDDTVSVFELGRRNGCSSGDFLKRAKHYIPDQDIFTCRRPEAYTPQMFYIGATIKFDCFSYHLTDADEFTLKYMEAHQSEYSMANISSIMSKIKEAIKPIYKEFIGKFLGVACVTETASNSESLNICYDTTALALRELLGKKITEHEIVTFLRYFTVNKTLQKCKQLDRLCIQSLIQTALINALWDEVQMVKEFIYECEPENHNGFISPKKLRTIIKGCRIPIKDILFDDMISVLNKDGNGNIEVNDFLYFIDYQKYKAPPIQPINAYVDDKSFNSSSRVELVNWSAFICELGLEKHLRQETE